MKEFAIVLFSLLVLLSCSNTGKPTAIKKIEIYYLEQTLNTIIPVTPETITGYYSIKYTIDPSYLTNPQILEGLKLVPNTDSNIRLLLALTYENGKTESYSGGVYKESTLANICRVLIRSIGIPDSP